MPLLLLYPVCHSPCHWLEIEVCQQLICMIVPHHFYTWLTAAQGIYLQRNKVALQHSKPQGCINNDQIMALKDAERSAAGRMQRMITWNRAVSKEGAKVRKE